MSEHKDDGLAVQICLVCHKLTPCLHQPVAMLLESAISSSCAKRDNDDMKIQLMVAHEHQAGSVAHRRMHLEHPHLSDLRMNFRWC